MSSSNGRRRAVLDSDESDDELVEVKQKGKQKEENGDFDVEMDDAEYEKVRKEERKKKRQQAMGGKQKDKKKSSKEKKGKGQSKKKAKHSDDSDDELLRLDKKTSKAVRAAGKRKKKESSEEEEEEEESDEMVESSSSEDEDDEWLDKKKDSKAAGRKSGKGKERKDGAGSSKKKPTSSSESDESKDAEESEEEEESEQDSEEHRRAARDKIELEAINNAVRRSLRALKDDEETPKKKENGKKRKRVVLSDSDVDGSNSQTKDKSDEEQFEDEEMDVDEEEKPKKKRGKKKAKIAESEESEDEMTRNKKAARKKSLMKDSDLLKSTKDAEKEEKERRQRLEERQKEFNGLVFDEDGIAGVLDDETGTSLKRLKEIILDPDEKSDDSLPVAVHPALVKKLKLHQAEGIRFMYNCAFESIDRLDGDGSGCILAHCMGLGKTLQCVAFLHTILNHEKISKCCNRALVVVPKNVIINWGKEFAKWLWDNDDELTLDIWMLEDYKTARDRADALRDWHEGGNPGVMIIGYEMFRMLCEDESTAKPKRPGAVPKKPKKLSKAKKLQLKYLEDFQKYLLDPGPDIVICDEAHRLKNSKSALSKVMNKIRTKRRLCLTGTPLQNNLMEYHCMMDFVRRGLLGSEAEFTNRFASIINRGRSKDATSNDVRYMVRRCHVLFHHLKGVVDRRDYSVLINSIPPKQEYVLKVRLTQVQCGLYRYFLDSFMDGERKHLLADYHVLARIWSHPYNLIAHEREKERQRILKGEDEELQDFIDDDEDALTTSEESGLETDALSDATNGTDELIGKKKKKNGGKAKDDKKKKGNGRGRAKQVDEEEEEDDDEIEILEDISGGRRKTGDEQSSSEMTEMATRRSRRLNNETPELNDRDCVTPLEYQGWYSGSNLVSETDSDNYELSNKLVLLASILKKCEEIGDKILVFSQSLESLSLIKRMLAWYTATDSWFEDGHAAILKPEGETWGWYEGLDYMVIDGSVMSSKRDNVQTKFNDKDNVRTRLMLISTRAGSLGTNMVAANRVVIFDACWNPSHDTQSLFRVYRFGQEKPVYIYRLIAQGTMEEKIYKRQVVKESTSMRVVDEAQIQRHFDRKEEEELYIFEPDELNEDPDETISARPAFAPPKDRLLADVLCEYPTAIVEYMQHDTLFQHIEEEKLNDKEMEDAWAEFEREKEGRANMAIAQMQQSETYMQNMLKLQAATLGLGANALLNASDQQNQLKMQQIARQMQQNEMARRQAGLALTRVTRDAVYAAALRVPQIEPMQAVEVALLKTSLDELLPTIPERLRGGISNFQPYFMTFCQDAISKKTGGKALLDKCAATFKTVVNLVKEETVCKATLRKIYPTTAKFFPVDFQP